MPDLTSRARGCLFGLAAGDALGGPTEGMANGVIAARWGRVTDFLAEDQSGSDDTEYALFNARLLLRHGKELTAELIADGWRWEIIGARNTFHGAGISEMMAIKNLRMGLNPPKSGQHLHSWSDGLAMRVAPFGIVAAGRPAEAARLAELDGAVTHSGEGIYAGKAVAAAVAAAMGGAEVPDILAAAQQFIPAESWTAAAIARAGKIGGESPDVWSALPLLYDACVTPAYFWSDLAPEAVGLALGVVVASRGEFRDAVLGGVNVGRDTDTIAAIAGAIAGARQGEEVIPIGWRERVRLVKGRCLSVVGGTEINVTADRLAELAERWSG